MKFKITTPKDKETVMSYLDKLPEGKRYDVTVALHREKRSIDQNALYWLWLTCISQETGNDKDDLHDYFKQRYISPQTRTVFAGTAYSMEVEKERSTSVLDTKQFTDYLDRIQSFVFSELGIILPDPEDQYWDQFYEQYKGQI